MGAPQALQGWVRETAAGQQCEAQVQAGARFAVAFSGGADSTALLRACVQRWGPSRVLALHVNHGLQPAARDFALHCVQACAALGVVLRTAAVQIQPSPTESIEALARDARYAALAELTKSEPSHEVDAVCAVGLGQHADDQVESVLIALLRGSGLPGLAGMAPDFTKHGVRFVRPLLACSRTELRQSLALQDGQWIEDPSNADPARTRNRLRAEVMPQLEALAPAFRSTVARSAAHAAQAAELLGDLALIDLAQVGSPPQIKALQGLSDARCANALRGWLAAHSVIPTQAQLSELIRQLHACTTRAHHIDVRCGRGRIARESEVLRWYNP